MTTCSETINDKDVETRDVHKVAASREKEDYLVSCIGAFGVWQAWICALACLVRFTGMWNLMNTIFLTHDTEFVCTSFNSSISMNVTTSACYDGCTMYQFSEGIFATKFVEDFGLVCDRAWVANLMQSVLMSGILCGTTLFGWISDSYGRRKTLILASLINVVLMLGSPFSPNYWVYLPLRFFIGLASGGVMVVGIVIILEVVGPQHMEIAGCLGNLPDGLAEASLSAFAYFAPTWRLYLLSLGIAAILISASTPLLSETPRWLMKSGRLDAFKELMMHAAKRNGIDADVAEENISKSITATAPCDTRKKSRFLDFFGTASMTLKTFAVFFIWMVGGLSYFGINLYVSLLASNVYISITILGLIQVPASLVAIWQNKAFDRKTSTILNFSVISLSMMLILIFPNHWVVTIMGITGMCASTMLSNTIYVYTSELYPTEVRNTAFGIAVTGSSLGAVLAPFVATLSPHWIPSVVFAVMPLVAAGICLTLPETKGQKLQDHFG